MRKSVTYLAAGMIVVAAGVSAALFIAFRKPALPVDAILAAYEEETQYGGLTIHYPLDETRFPPEIVPPRFRWTDSRDDSDAWLIMIEFRDGSASPTAKAALGRPEGNNRLFRFRQIRRGRWGMHGSGGLGAF
jgi:hypothetical protein